jgi:hypothetical protein
MREAEAVPHPPETDVPGRLVDPDSPWLKACLVLMFLLAVLIRLYNLEAPGHLIDREYTSAIFARAYYFEGNQNIPAWRQEIAKVAKDQQPVLEPPINDFLVSLIYRLFGREDIVYSRYLTIFFWLVGGVFMYRIADTLLGTDAAVFAYGYYLFVPMGIIISRSFQPDSLMMMLFLISLYAAVRYFKNPTFKMLMLASLLSGITLLIRPLVVFSLLLTFLALTLHARKSWKAVFDPPLIIYSTISLFFPLAYYGYGILFAGFMRWKISTSFMPHLLTKFDFWQGWFESGSEVIGPALLVSAILGFFLLQNRQLRSWIVAFAVSYVIFGIAFTYHINTHPYYHIQIIPLIGISAAPVIIRIGHALKQIPDRNRWLPVVAAVLAVLYFNANHAVDSYNTGRYESPTIAREIGKIVNHSPRVAYVAKFYGLPLEYYGEFGGAPWPVGIEDAFYRRPGETYRSVDDRINGLGFTPEYFVITHFDLYRQKHKDLAEFLENNWQLIAQGEGFLIYAQKGYLHQK